MQVKELGEFGLIKALLQGQPQAQGVIVPPGDDAAVVEITPGKRLVYTCDCMVEDVHFLPTARGADVGYKLLAINISDIAAMGGVPKYAVVTLVVPGTTAVEWLKEVYRGISDCAALYNVALVGGDTSRGDQIMLNIALVGEIEPGKEMLRKNARVGDLVCVTGPLGGSAAGLRVVTKQFPESLPAALRALEKHYRPRPRVQEGLVLAELGCRCANDISDGLASEALEIALASGVGLELRADFIPMLAQTVHIATYCGEEALHYALYGGEDYELVFTIAEKTLPQVQSAMPKTTVIGAVTEGKGVVLVTDTGTLALDTAYNHFR